MFNMLLKVYKLNRKSRKFRKQSTIDRLLILVNLLMTDDPVPLTPNMFVRDTGLAYFPELDIRDANSARATHRRICELRMKLRSQFKREYLGQHSPWNWKVIHHGT